MKIKSPLTDKKEVKLLCEAGADELFCGVEPYEWRRKYKDFSINQRSTGANFTRLKDLERAISIAHRYKVRVHVTVNAFFYLEGQYYALKEIIKDILNVGADGLIFAEPTPILNIDKSLLKFKDVIIGCDAVILNSSAVDFYKQLGATRVVFPRAMTLQEMEEVVSLRPSMEYEVFIIHDLCFFEDGFCAYCKEASGRIKKEARPRKNIYLFSGSRIPGRGFGGGCRARFRKQKIATEDDRKIGKSRAFTFWEKKHIEGCGACAIQGLKKIGIRSLKVLDRNLPVEEKVKATGFIKGCLDELKNNGLSKADYFAYCKRRFKDVFKVKCNQYDCYYPGVFKIKG